MIITQAVVIGTEYAGRGDGTRVALIRMQQTTTTTKENNQVRSTTPAQPCIIHDNLRSFCAPSPSLLVSARPAWYHQRGWLASSLQGTQVHGFVCLENFQAQAAQRASGILAATNNVHLTTPPLINCKDLRSAVPYEIGAPACVGATQGPALVHRGTPR